MIEALGRWNIWNHQIDSGIKRDITDKIFENLEYDKIITLFGFRRVGKSYVLKQLINALNVPKENMLVVNFEDPVFEDASLETLIKIYEAYKEIIKPKGKPFLFLDEIQEVPKWEKFVRALNERKDAHIIITGSSSKLLSEEFATLLTGRQLNFEIFPLSFKEFLRFKGINIESEKDIYLNTDPIKTYIHEYLKFGGFPEVVLIDNIDTKRMIFVNYYETVISKDIVGRFKIREIEKIKGLAKYYLTNAGTLITYRKISGFLNIPVETISRFSEYMQIANIIFFVKRFSFSVKEQENSPRKVYCIDAGLINTIGFKFSENIGRILENLVAIELLRRGGEIYYWKDQKDWEVDFIVKEGLTLKQLIQVCYNISNYTTKEREVKAIIKASDELKCKNLFIITESYEAEEEFGGKCIKFVPLWKWLLSEK